MNKDPKVAIVHDWLWSMAGAARVTEAFLELYPEADLYMLLGDINNLSEPFQKAKVKYSWLQRIPFIKKFYRYTYFLWPMAVEGFDLSEYDLVVSSSQAMAKGVITGVNTKHVTYIHSPMRYGWDMYFDYFNKKTQGPIRRVLISILVHYLRIWDVTSADRADVVITNSSFVKDRFEKYYDRKVDHVVNPPVHVDRCTYSNRKDDYYLAVSPFEPNKGGELLIEAAKEYGFNLKVIGSGSMKKKLMRKARGHRNIEFTGWFDEDKKYGLIANARALISAGIEDYGIAMVEAIVSGTPVVTFHQGGGAGIVKDGVTGIHFSEVTKESLYEAIRKADDLKVQRVDTKQYSKERFKEEISEILSD